MREIPTAKQFLEATRYSLKKLITTPLDIFEESQHGTAIPTKQRLMGKNNTNPSMNYIMFHMAH